MSGPATHTGSDAEVAAETGRELEATSNAPAWIAEALDAPARRRPRRLPRYVVLITALDGTPSVVGPFPGSDAAEQWATDHQTGESGWACQALRLESPPKQATPRGARVSKATEIAALQSKVAAWRKTAEILADLTYWSYECNEHAGTDEAPAADCRECEIDTARAIYQGMRDSDGLGIHPRNGVTTP
jgi:hypothetical protein